MATNYPPVPPPAIVTGNDALDNPYSHSQTPSQASSDFHTSSHQSNMDPNNSYDILQPPPATLAKSISRPSSVSSHRSSNRPPSVQSSPQLAPLNDGPLPRSASTPAVNHMGSPYGHQQQSSSSNTLLLYPQTQYRNSRLSRPLSSRSSFSSLDFAAPGVTGRENRSHSPAPSEVLGSSAFDLNQSFLATNLGENSASLLPRIKTIELYRKNAKKSNDPVIQFQFAQYMLQTALLAGNKSDKQNLVDEETQRALQASRGHGPNESVASFTAPSVSQNTALTDAQEQKIKRDLLKEAINHLQKLSSSGFPDAQYLLGDAYSSGALGKPDLKESFLLFQLAAKHGHAEASYRTALCLEEGWGVGKDARRSVQFLRQAASRSHPGAMLRLGIACFYGKLGLHMGSSAAKGKTQLEGIKWLTRASETANETFPQGPYELAKIYEVGYKDIVFKDMQYTVQLYVKSADLNYGPAASKLGHAYEYGELDCPQDASLSIHYYTIAALGGDPTAMLAMCAWYMVGADPMLPRNEEEAYEWAVRAADRGLAKAQYAAGYFLENGIGCDRDILASTSYYRKAAQGGDDRAVERLKVNRQLASQQQTKHRKRKEDNEDGDKEGSKKECIIM